MVKAQETAPQVASWAYTGRESPSANKAWFLPHSFPFLISLNRIFSSAELRSKAHLLSFFLAGFLAFSEL